MINKPSLDTPPPEGEGETNKPIGLKNLIRLDETEKLKPRNPDNWIVKNLLYTGQFSVLAARPKVGKSSLTRFLTAQMSLGMPFLGRPTKKSTIIYCALEERSDVVAASLEKYENNSQLIYVYSPTSLNKLEIQRELFEHVKEINPALVIIDTLGDFLQFKDINDYKLIEEFQKILAFIRETNTHFLFIHHTSKNSLSSGESALLGTTVISAKADCILSMRTDTGSKRIISSQQREGISFRDEIIHWNEETNSYEAAGSKVQDPSIDVKNNILLFLERNGPSTYPEILKSVPGKSTRIHSALRELVSDSKVWCTGEGKKGNPNLYSIPLPPSAGQVIDKATNSEVLKNGTN